MPPKQDVIRRLRGNHADPPLYLPDLTLWYDWHAKRRTLPVEWRGWSLAQIARSLGVPVWQAARPFRIESGNVEVYKSETASERLVRYHTPAGKLTERWNLGPDGDWWQTEFPVKTASDLRTLLRIVSARRYVLDTSELERLAAEIGDDGVVALELPRRPFSQVFLEWLGWSDGLLLFFDAPALVGEIMEVLEQQVQSLVEQVIRLPDQIIVSPDNLDAQFISPTFFQRYLADSYRRTAGVLHASDKILLAGTGGPIAKLLQPLANTGVDGVEGISGPPQSDAGLAEARQLAGPAFTLWGGIPQDALLPDFDRDRFEALVLQAVREARNDSRAIIGVADRVPVLADIGRLRSVPSLLAAALSNS
ncbi:MAG: hypothetical protein H6647_07865 [Anaerolineales bacterium]|nr:hypothetical protein [Anaerolineales bacterium]